MISDTTADSTALESGSDIGNIMFTLGKIARVVFPNGDIPAAMQMQLLERPALGLGMLTRCESYKRVDRRVLGPLFCKLPPNFQTPDGVDSGAKLQFWNAFFGD